MLEYVFTRQEFTEATGPATLRKRLEAAGFRRGRPTDVVELDNGNVLVRQDDGKNGLTIRPAPGIMIPKTEVKL